MKWLASLLTLGVIPVFAAGDVKNYDLCGPARPDLTVCVTLSVTPTKSSQLELRYENGERYSFPAVIEREPGHFDLLSYHYAQGFVKNTLMYFKLKVDDTEAIHPIYPPIPPKGEISYRLHPSQPWQPVPNSGVFTMKVPVPIEH